MQTRLLSEEGGLNTFAVILETGDEAMACLQEFAEVEGITAARFSAIGAFMNGVVFPRNTKNPLFTMMGSNRASARVASIPPRINAPSLSCEPPPICNKVMSLAGSRPASCNST